MSRIIGIILIVIVVIALLVWFGFMNVTPEGERAIDETQQGVGGAIEDTGSAIQGAGDGTTVAD